VFGAYPEQTSFATEYGVYYHLQPDAVHNCGLYLDARPLRQWLLQNSRDRRVLNLFAFTGSLGLAAAKGGAEQVVHLDKSAELLPRIRESHSKNALAFDDRNFLRGDIYKHLPRAIKHKQRFDGILLDPPPKVYASRFAQNRPRGQDFSQLVKMCSKLLNPNGWLVAMFHRFDASWDEQEQEIVHAAGGRLAARERMTSDIDFPESNIENKLRISVFENTST
jgi:23S rRNA (cytosine1962-C5)-methyltransferase